MNHIRGLLAFASVLLAAQVARSAERFEIVLTGGRIGDGTGAPWYVADVGIRDGKIAEICFDGHGCSISQASASIMTQKLTGRPVAEAQELVTRFLQMMRGEIPFGGRELGELKALEGVLKFPVRVKCATLAWHVADQGLRQLPAGQPSAGG